jgi:hypothetical protein
MIRSDGTPELTPRQKDLFITNTIRIAHSRMTPAQKDAALNYMCEAFIQAPAVDDVESVVIEMSAPRLKQLSGMSESTAGECKPVLEAVGMKHSHRREQVTGGRYVTQVFVDVPLALPQLPQTRPAPTPRAQKWRDAAAETHRLADLATELLNTPCPVCGAVGEWHLHCHACGATWTASAASVGAEPDIKPHETEPATGMLSQHAGETADFLTSDAATSDYGTGMLSQHAGETVTEGGNSPDKDLCTTGNSPFGECGTRSYDVEVKLEPLPAAASYVPGPDEHPSPLIEAIGTQKRFLPCKVIPVEGDKPKKIPLRQGADGKPTADGWQDPEVWITYYAVEAIASDWRANAISVQHGGPEHDFKMIDLDKCASDGKITSERAAQIVAYLNTYTTVSASEMFLPVYGLHAWLIDRTGLIPNKFDESDDIGIYGHCKKHACETLKSFGPVLPLRVITDPAQARTICRVLGVVPTDEQVIAPPVPYHAYGTPGSAPAAGTTDRQTWAQGLLARLSADRCDEYDSWIRVGMALSEFGTAGLSMWDQWSRGSKKYKPGECERKWKSFDSTSGVTLGSLYHWANEDDPGGK